MRPKEVSPLFSAGLAVIACALLFATNARAVSEKVIHDFIIYPDGANPVGNLIADAAGNLFGTTQYGGDHGYGAVFRLTRKPDGKWVETVLHSFDDQPAGAIWAWFPNGGLTFDASGSLYGTTEVGGDLACGVCGCGTVFKLTPLANGNWNFDIIYRFHGKNDGSLPNGGVVLDAAGNVYGTTFGNLSSGTVFELTPSSTAWQGKTIYRFAAGIAYNIAIDAVGDLYGVLSGSGIFQLQHANGKWNENLLCSGCSATGIPAFDSAGNLYVDANDEVLELLRKQSWMMTVIDKFSGSDGSFAAGTLTFDKNGNLYGTTESGGDLASCNRSGCGTAFRLMRGKNGDWQHQVLYRFKGNHDGTAPDGMIFDSHGDLYGTTLGDSNDPTACDHGRFGCGTVFELSTASNGNWQHVVIDRFGIGDGDGPPSGLVADLAGNLYGTMSQGSVASSAEGCGMVYELTPTRNAGWKKHTLYEFKCGTADGMNPASSLIFDSSGNLYGTTVQGGSACPGSGCGTVFELSPSAGGAWTEAILYNFKDDADGSHPAGGLVFDTTGKLYGVTEYGGNGPCKNNSGSVGCGVVYQLSSASGGGWNEKSLHNFMAGAGDGAFPAAAALVFDQAGNLYGTTTKGGNGSCRDKWGNSGCGAVIKLSPGSGGVWTESALYDFTDAPPSPNGLTIDPQGNLYGTTEYGGPTSDDCPHGCGTVYELSHSSGSWVATVLYNFGGFKGDGRFSQGVLTLDATGALYGTTSAGGAFGCGYDMTSDEETAGCGAVFRLSPSSGGWTESILHSFGGPLSDGKFPASGVILDAKGNFYGTTNAGGVDQGEYTRGGTIFEITP